MFSDFFNLLFAPVLALGNVTAITLISMLLSLVIVLVYKYTADQAAMRSLKEQIEAERKKSSDAQKSNDLKTMNDALSKMTDLNKKYLSMSTKPMLFSSLIFLPFLPWFFERFKDLTINLPFQVPFAGSSLSWFWWYLLLSIPFNAIIRKILDAEM